MDKQNSSLTILVASEIPVETQWIKDSLARFFYQPLDIILLHVIDSKIMDSLEKNGVSRGNEILEQYRQRAEQELEKAKHELGLSDAQTMVVQGIPFLEIIKLSKDLHVDLVAMKMRSGNGRVENFFFGSTTERVLRGSSIPVICLP